MLMLTTDLRALLLADYEKAATQKASNKNCAFHGFFPSP